MWCSYLLVLSSGNAFYMYITPILSPGESNILKFHKHLLDPSSYSTYICRFQPLLSVSSSFLSLYNYIPCTSILSSLMHFHMNCIHAADTEMRFGGLISTSNIVKGEVITVHSTSDLLWTVSLKKLWRISSTQYGDF